MYDVIQDCHLKVQLYSYLHDLLVKVIKFENLVQILLYNFTTKIKGDLEKISSSKLELPYKAYLWMFGRSQGDLGLGRSHEQVLGKDAT